VAADAAGHLIRASVARLVAAATRQRAALAATLGITPTDLLALHHIGRVDDLTPGELAQALLLSSGGTAAVVDRLSRAGLVSRTTGSGSRRRVLLRLTPEARSLIAPPLAPLVADVDGLAAELSAAERAGIERFLARLADLSERHADRLVTEAQTAEAAASGAPSPVLWG
jgi:DNA-binding MarR family transcriptional regulator